MKALTLLITILTGSFAVAANIPVQADKIFDGFSVSCQNSDDLNKKGLILSDVTFADLNDGSARLTFNSPFVVCTTSGLQQAHDPEFFKFTAQNSNKQTFQLQHLSPELVLKNSNSKEVQIVSLNTPSLSYIAIDVRVIDLLDEKTKRQLDQDGQAVLSLDVFLRTQLSVTSPLGVTENWGYRTTGAYRLLISVKK